jgi:ribose/xylose/arabinose/galactoside ABC-type transport system permease subunit
MTERTAAATTPATVAGPGRVSDPRWKGIVRYIATEHLIWPILLLMVIVGAFVPGFLTGGNLVNLLWGAAPLGCMVVGLYFVMIAGKLDLSLESTFALAPTVGVLMMTQWLHLNPILGMVVTLLVGALIGAFNGVVSIGLNVNPFLVTLATLLALRGVVVYLIPEGVYDLPPTYAALGGRKLIGGIPIAVLVLLVLFAVAYVVMRYTTFGRSLVGIGNNEAACRIAGINVSAVNIMAFVVAGLCAALGGLLQTGRLFSVDASMGTGDILIVFAATTLGGTALNGGHGRVTGLLGAILVIGGITNLMNLVGVGASTQQIIFGVVLLGAILLSSLQDRLRVVRA